jgi:hypothetical protein
LRNRIGLGNLQVFDRRWLHNSNYLFADGVVHGNSTEGNASRLPIIQPAAMARITKNRMITSGIAHGQLTATSRASQEAR